MYSYCFFAFYCFFFYLSYVFLTRYLKIFISSLYFKSMFSMRSFESWLIEISTVVFELFWVINGLFGQFVQLGLQFLQMLSLFFHNSFHSGHLISDQSAWMLVFEHVDLFFVVFDLFVSIIELLFEGIGWTLVWDQFVLSFGRGLGVFVFIKHFIDLDDFVLKLTVALLKLLNVFGSKR